MASPNTVALQKERLLLRSKQVHSTTQTPYVFTISRYERRKLLRKHCREHGLNYHEIKEEDARIRKALRENEEGRQARALSLLKEAIERSKSRGYEPPEGATDEELHQHFKAWLTKRAEQNEERHRQAAKAEHERTIREAVEAQSLASPHDQEDVKEEGSN